MADRIMNGLPVKQSLVEKLKIVFYFLCGYCYEHDFLESMRYYSYYENKSGGVNFIEKIHFTYIKIKYKVLGQKLGFSIGYNCFGYGLVMSHYGTIVINPDTRVGNFCVLFASTFIGGKGKRIGDNFYFATGAHIMGHDISIGNNVSVGCNSVVLDNFGDNLLVVGSPAKVAREDYPVWWERDGQYYKDNVKKVLALKSEMGIEDI